LNLSPNLFRSLGKVSGVSSHDQVDFPIQRQLMSNWCWAACTVSICTFYEDGTNEDQRQFVADTLGNPICSSDADLDICNETFDFGIALDNVGHLTEKVDSVLTITQLKNALNQGVVGCQLEIPGIGGHVVVAVQARTTGNNVFVQVADPSDGSLLIMPYAELKNGYRGTGGSWIRSYLTKTP